MKPNRLVLTTFIGAVLVTAACSGNESSLLEPGTAPAFAKGPGGNSGPGGPGWGDTKPSSCKPLPARTESKEIGPKGGELKIGPHTLVVAPGALPHKTRITGTISADTVNSVRFSPEGLQFTHQVHLYLSYENCKKIDLKDMKVVYTTDDLSTILEMIPSKDKKYKNTVVGLIDHFSRYAIAY